jgi:acyl carrier protein
MEEKIAQFIVTEILKNPGRMLRADEALISSGLIDSFSLVDLALFVEDTFGVRIEDSELTSSVFDTINELTAFVQERQST